jgi:hypothetical protein
MRSRIIGRQRLISEGARVVTPVIESAERVGPMAIAWGTPDDITSQMRGLAVEWIPQRRALLTYANLHPSDDVRKLGHEAVEAVEKAFASANYLFLTQQSNESAMDAFKEAEACHERAKVMTKKPMDVIRA